MILFVDDETRVMSTYELELHLARYNVKFEANVDKALEFFTNNLEAIKLLVLDVMMSPGEAFKNADVEGGLRTGISFYRFVRQRAPDLQVMIFTNVSAEDVAEYFRHEPMCWFGQKTEYLPHEFLEEVKRFYPLPPTA